jgi:hypothetical protein
VGFAIPIARALPSADADRRLSRLRALAWFLDRSIPVGRWRVGVDPIIGLLPGAGDWIGALLSTYVLYEGARLGVSAGVLSRMAGNILVETIFGAVPVLGDLFDFAWKANARNLALIERHYHPELRARSLRRLWFAVVLFALLLLGVSALLMYFVVQGALGLLH